MKPDAIATDNTSHTGTEIGLGKHGIWNSHEGIKRWLRFSQYSGYVGCAGAKVGLCELKLDALVANQMGGMCAQTGSVLVQGTVIFCSAL